MTTNTSANPLASPPQRIRLDDQSDIVFQDALTSAPPSPIPTGLTIDHIAVMIRDQRAESREQRAEQSREQSAQRAEIREMGGRFEEMESRLMIAIDTRVNALSNDIAGASQTLHDVQLQMDMVREDVGTNQEQISINEQQIQDLTNAQADQRSEIHNLRDQFSARHAALLNGTISELIRRIETLEQNTNQNPNNQASNQLSDL